MSRAAVRRACTALALALLATACAHPLEGRIWHPASGAYVDEAALWQRAAAARHVLLGEIHDNADHHDFQRRTLEALAARGQRRALAMEQFDIEHQAAIDAATADAEATAHAGRFDRRGWDWSLYRPLVEFAVAHAWPLRAANRSRERLRTAVPAPTPPAAIRALEQDMIDGHCGYQPPAARLAAMVDAQRARDQRMAAVIAAARETGSVLIAGNGHVRRDRGVPLYVNDGALLVIGQLEVRSGIDAPADYVSGGFATATSYDYVRFTAAASRPDPCAGFRAGASGAR
ncbi:MAG: ChaN family lipoprotein [Burkholderiales bacterium]